MKGIKTNPDSLQSKIQAVMMQKMQLAREAERAEGSKLAAENKAKGKAFLEKISKQAGVMKDLFLWLLLRNLEKRHCPSHERCCPSPTMSDTVYYHGTLIDGTVFDRRCRPRATYQLSDERCNQRLLRRIDQMPSGWESADLYSKPPPGRQDQTRRHPHLRMRVA